MRANVDFFIWDVEVSPEALKTQKRAGKIQFAY